MQEGQETQATRSSTQQPLYMVADPYKFAKLSPAFSKKPTKHLLEYNKNVPGDQRAFVMKDLSVITPTSNMATTWHLQDQAR